MARRVKRVNKDTLEKKASLERRVRKDRSAPKDLAERKGLAARKAPMVNLERRAHGEKQVKMEPKARLVRRDPMDRLANQAPKVNQDRLAQSESLELRARLVLSVQPALMVRKVQLVTVVTSALMVHPASLVLEVRLGNLDLLAQMESPARTARREKTEKSESKVVPVNQVRKESLARWVLKGLLDLQQYQESRVSQARPALKDLLALKAKTDQMDNKVKKETEVNEAWPALMERTVLQERKAPMVPLVSQEKLEIQAQQENQVSLVRKVPLDRPERLATRDLMEILEKMVLTVLAALAVPAATRKSAQTVQQMAPVTVSSAKEKISPDLVESLLLSLRLAS